MMTRKTLFIALSLSVLFFVSICINAKESKDILLGSSLVLIWSITIADNWYLSSTQTKATKRENWYLRNRSFALVVMILTCIVTIFFLIVLPG